MIVEEVMIKRIITAARTGERDITRLQQAALAGLGKAERPKVIRKAAVRYILSSLHQAGRTGPLPIPPPWP
jgi:hypothetical protein